MPTQFTKAEQAEARADLAAALAGATRDGEGRVVIYSVLRRIGASGMTRHISPMVICAATGEPNNLAFDFAKADKGRSPDEVHGFAAVKVQGAGMDMGFHLAGRVARLGDVGDAGFVHRWL